MKAKEFIKKYKDEQFNCVYRLISSKGVVVYVGCSSFPSNRISSHVSSHREFESVEFDVCGCCEMRSVEARQIVKYNPIYNTELTHSDEFPKLKHMQDDVCKEIKSLMKDLPYAFSRGRDKHVLMGDANKLKADILKAAQASLVEIHNKETP